MSHPVKPNEGSAREVDRSAVDALAVIASSGTAVTVDVENLQVHAGGRTWPFRLGAAQQLSLLEGLDDLGLAMRDMPAIRSWENSDQITRPWSDVTLPQLTSTH